MRLVGVLVVLVVLAGVFPGIAGSADADENPCTGRITEPAEGVTVISVQGFRMRGENRGKRPARLIGVGPEGEIEWVHRLGQRHDVVWSYDVDPLPNGNLFGVATRKGETVFYELDVATGEWVWSRTLNITDTHDADMLDRHRILIANMRNYEEESGENDDRILIYNRTSEEVVWEWKFREADYEPEDGGKYAEDWTHVNDVDRIAPGKFLLSPRNFDQVVVLDRASGEITLRLGRDDDFETMKQQHNPQYLESEDGSPTILVSDSENDRIVEYERRGDSWERTWRLGGPETLSWPRDADRLPDGDTLVVDSANDRVLEVTPEGEVVWEFYAPWLVYDVERLPYGDEAGGPTIADRGAAGSYELSNGEPWSPDDVTSCAAAIRGFENDFADNTTPTSTTPTRDQWVTEESATPLGGSEDDQTPRDSTPEGGVTRSVAEATPSDPGGTNRETDTDERTRTPGQSGFGVLAAVVALFVAVLARR
jgi:hypothetical protein